MRHDQTTQDIADLYADISACMLALANALDAAGVLSKQQIADSAQERLLAMQPAGGPDVVAPHPLLMLRMLAVGLTSTPAE